MRPEYALLILIVNITVCIGLFEPSPSDDWHRAHRASDLVVIQSRPYNGQRGGENREADKLRRNLVIEKEDQTEPKQIPQYAIDCGDDKVCLEAHGLDYPDATFKPYTQEELEGLLAQYTASHGHPPGVEENTPSNKLANLYMDNEDAVINVLETNPINKEKEESKSASWHLVNSHKQQHPYDDKKNWVSLEPVPWAQSQIQKWEPNAKPQIPTWDSSSHHRPSSSHWNSADYPTQKPWHKPSYEYKPTWSQWTRPQERPPQHDGGWGPNPDIITDNQPGYFPGPPPSHRPWYDQEPYSSNTPTQGRPAHVHPASHPSEGDGQWVLLSSTKGYSTAYRDRGQYQRAFTFNSKSPSGNVPAASVASHRAVKLTVLPADNSTNSTLSHGGLIEVDSIQQTVEEAQREHAAKMIKLKTLTPENVKANPGENKEKPKTSVRVNSRRSGENIQVFSASPADVQNSKTAVLAAIGAGLVPASMAMLLPMVLGRRRRSVENNDFIHVMNDTKFQKVLRVKK